MKLLRVGPKGQEKPAILDEKGVIRDVSHVTPDYAGKSLSLEAIEDLRNIDLSSMPELDADARIGSCLADTPNFHCVGLNYVNHAKESGMPIPEEPVLFSKATSSLSGPNDPVIIPKDSTKTDWEVELGIVIGATVNHISEADALSVVSGYCLVNDVSEREFQLEKGGQWVKGKSAPTFGPTGPWLVTPDELGDPQNLAMTLKVNGEVQQSSNTADMIFTCAQIISYMSRYMELRPGDLISTGTPEGVGMGQSPQRWLQPGDVMTLEMEKLGHQKQIAQAFSNTAS